MKNTYIKIQAHFPRSSRAWRFIITDPFQQHPYIAAFEDKHRQNKDFLVSLHPDKLVFIKYIFCNFYNCTAAAALVKFNRTVEFNIVYGQYCFGAELNRLYFWFGSLTVVREGGYSSIRREDQNFLRHQLFWNVPNALVTYRFTFGSQSFNQIIETRPGGLENVPSFLHCLLGTPMNIGNSFKEMICCILLIIIFKIWMI